MTGITDLNDLKVKLYNAALQFVKKMKNDPSSIGIESKLPSGSDPMVSLRTNGIGDAGERTVIVIEEGGPIANPLCTRYAHVIISPQGYSHSIAMFGTQFEKYARLQGILQPKTVLAPKKVLRA